MPNITRLRAPRFLFLFSLFIPLLLLLIPHPTQADNLLGWYESPIAATDPIFGPIPNARAVPRPFMPRGGYFDRGYGIGYWTNYRDMSPAEWERLLGRTPGWRERRVREQFRREQEWRKRTGLPPLAVPRFIQELGAAAAEGGSTARSS